MNFYTVAVCNDGQWRMHDGIAEKQRGCWCQKFYPLALLRWEDPGLKLIAELAIATTKIMRMRMPGYSGSVMVVPIPWAGPSDVMILAD